MSTPPIPNTDPPFTIEVRPTHVFTAPVSEARPVLFQVVDGDGRALSLDVDAAGDPAGVTEWQPIGFVSLSLDVDAETGT